MASKAAAIGYRVSPFLKWAGGKRQLLTQFQSFFPQDYDRYVEPFLGSGAVFFHVARLRPVRQAVLIDNNRELITTFQAIRDNVQGVLDRLAELKGNHSRAQYYRVRDEEPRTPENIAARLIYLNKTCFNGLYRVNSRGRFNVPMGRYNNPRIYDEANLREAGEMLKGVELRTGHFAECLKIVTPDDFVYFDPPYQPLSATSSFTGYTRGSFGEADQRQLADVYRQLSRRGSKLMLSNSNSPLVRELYSEFRIETVYARRHINSRVDRRGAIAEIVVLNY